MPLQPAPESVTDNPRRRRRGRRRRDSILRSVEAPEGAIVTQVQVQPRDDGTFGQHGMALTAAAQVMFSPRTSLAKKRRPLPQQPWQKEAWKLYREAGEFRFAGDRTARAGSRARLFIGKRPAPDQDVSPVDDPNLMALSESMFGDAAANAMSLMRALQHLAFNGDTIIVVSDAAADVDDTDGNPTQHGHTWSAYSTSEVTGLDGVSRPKLSDGQTAVELTDDQLAIRCYTPDPELMAFAGSPARAVLSPARELVQLTKYVSAQIDSRLAGAGLLLVPAGIKVMEGQQAEARRETADDPNAEPDDENADDTGGQPFTFADVLAETMLVPVEDRASAASLVPLVAEVDKEFLATGKAAQLITFDRPLDAHTKELRDEAIRRIALGMDSDPSVLLGLGGANHWTGWLVSEDEVKLSVSPLLGTICHALNTGWLQPVLRAMGVDDPQKYTVWYDTSVLELRPDRSEDALKLYEKAELSADTLRRETGFGDTDKPSPEERREQIILQLVIGAPTLAPVLLPLIGITLDNQQTETAQKIAEVVAGTPAPGTAPPTDDPPSPPAGPPATQDTPPPGAGGDAS